MINLIIFFIIFIIIVYCIFHIFVTFSKSFDLIDEEFNNIVSNVKDNNIKNIFNENELENNIKEVEDTENDVNKHSDKMKLNKYLRYDFLISLFLGILWFLFPFLVINLTQIEKINFNKKSKYLGKYLGLITVLTAISTLFYLKKPKNEKIKLLSLKLFASLIIILSLFINIHYLKRINFSNIITLFLTSIWMFNSILGLLEYNNFNINF